MVAETVGMRPAVRGPVPVPVPAPTGAGAVIALLGSANTLVVVVTWSGVRLCSILAVAPAPAPAPAGDDCSPLLCAAPVPTTGAAYTLCTLASCCIFFSFAIAIILSLCSLLPSSAAASWESLGAGASRVPNALPAVLLVRVLPVFPAVPALVVL